VLAVCCLAALVPPSADAYVVCSWRCPHEYMAAKGADLFSNAEIAANFSALEQGVTHEDHFDHVYGQNVEIPVIGQPLVTASHFWNADLGPEVPAKNAAILGEFPNSWQKVRAFWLLAIGAYENGDKPAAYHYLGHIVHHFGDHTVPAHAKDDPHGPEPVDDDSFHDWMDELEDGVVAPNARLTDAELDALRDDGPIEAPQEESDKLLWLLYSTNQVADFFASDDFDGDSTAAGYPGNPLAGAKVQDELDTLAQDPENVRLQDADEFDDNDFGDDNDDGDLGVVREHSYKRGIRAIAGLYRLFEETVNRQVSLYVVIDRVEEDEGHDPCIPVPSFPLPVECAPSIDPDFYSRVSIGDRASRNRGEQIENTEDIDPNWAYGNTVGTGGSVPVRLEIWDHDGAYDDIITTGDEDDPSDIDGGDASRAMNLTVDLAKCLRREAGAISGDLAGDCGTQIVSAGDADDEAALVTFRILMSNAPPNAEAGGPYATDEGKDVKLDATGSTDPDDDITHHAWDFDGDGECDDAEGAAPDFTRVGQDGETTVTLCVRDATGMTDRDTATVTVDNVTPSIEIGDPTAVAENTAVTVSGTIRDPGWLDELSATIDWGDGTAVQNVTGAAEHERPDSTLALSAPHTYGDNGTYSVTVCAADDDTAPCRSVAVKVTNVDPAAVIDTTGTVSVDGVPTVIAHAGASVDFGVRLTDPGSDDLSITWDWGDGTPVDTSTSLVNPPAPDPPSSPSIRPRDISATSGHAFAKACVYTSGLKVGDDDGGATTGSLNVIIVGNGRPNRPHGFWKQQHRHHAFATGPRPDFAAATLGCYLDITAYMSRVFDEKTAAATFAQAYDVLDTRSTSNIDELFDQQLLAAWLNFAHGAIEWDRLVDTDGDGRPDTRFLTAIEAAEDLRLDPAATRRQLDAMKKVVESWTSLP